MSLRELFDADCGAANPLMRLGNQIAHDVTHKDEGIAGRPMHFAETSARSPQNFADSSQNQLVNEYLGQMGAPPPQSFRMDALLHEMREIDAQHYPLEVVRAPTVSDEVHNGISWAGEFQDINANDTTLARLQPKTNIMPVKQNDEKQVCVGGHQKVAFLIF